LQKLLTKIEETNKFQADAWHLKQHISGDCNKIDQQLIDSAVKQWRKRLAACVSARGGHLEHML